MKNADQPAFPCDHEISIQGEKSGITKREYFAAMAMQALLTKGECIENAAELAKDAADELLKQL